MTNAVKSKSEFRNPPSELVYHICPTSLGYAAILFQEHPFLVRRILLPRSHKSTLTKEIQRIGTAKPGRRAAVLNMCRDMKAYFHGALIETPWKSLDLGGLTPLQRSVLRAVASVPHGQVRSYGEIAAQVGRPRAFRFVGTTLAQNPFPLFIPCHRIVRADGSLGGFGGGAKLKKRMLSLEKQNA
jgi:methylated-DNA-[protein]-cysteine S-methyltransferase